MTTPMTPTGDPTTMSARQGRVAADAADQADAAVSTRRAPMALVTGAFIVLVVVIGLVLLIVELTRGTAAPKQVPISDAPGDVVHQATAVPLLAFNTVGAPAPVGPAPVVLTGQPPLTIDGRPGVVYVGAEFCPYCAAERWALVVALGRFGTFSHLGTTTSSDNEAFAEIPTFSFDGTTYRSRYVSWSAVEQYGQTLSTTAPAGFPPLDTVPLRSQSLMARYGTDPASGPTLPFVDIGNHLVVEGASIGFSPGTLQGLSMTEIAADLSNPNSPVAQSVLGAANLLTAAICASTGDRPGSVCRTPGVRAGANRLGL